MAYFKTFGKKCRFDTDINADHLRTIFWRFETAIHEIDNSIDHLQKTKEALLGADRNLRLANDKALDVTIKIKSIAAASRQPRTARLRPSTTHPVRAQGLPRRCESHNPCPWWAPRSARPKCRRPGC